MIEKKPLLVRFEKGKMLQDEVNEKKGEREDGSGGWFHIEAGEHKAEPDHRTGIDGHTGKQRSRRRG